MTCRYLSSRCVGLLAAICVSLPLCSSPGAAQAAEPLRWAAPEVVSTAGWYAAYPWVVTDPFGLVHVFWIEEPIDPENPLIRDPAKTAIVHRQWDGELWTDAVDVLLSPDGSGVAAPVAAVDSRGLVHVAWVSNWGTIYHASAHALQAASGQAWSAPSALSAGIPTGQRPIALAADDSGAVHLLYTSRISGMEVLHVSSADGGLSWSLPTSVSAGVSWMPQGAVAGSVTLVTDSADGLHAAWVLHNQAGFGEIILYASSTDGGRTWSPPQIIAEKGEDDYDVDWPGLAVTQERIVVAAWSGVGRPPGRSYRVSLDGGQTWAPIIHFMEGMVGETENIPMPVDNAGRVHLFTPARTTTNDSGVRYLMWEPGSASWSEPYKIPGPLPNPAAYPALRVSAAVRLGHQLVVAWHDEPNGKVLFSCGDTGLAPLAPLEAKPPELPEHPAEPSAPTEPASTVLGVLSAGPTSPTLPTVSGGIGAVSSAKAIAAGLGAALVVLCVAVLLSWSFRRR